MFVEAVVEIVSEVVLLLEPGFDMLGVSKARIEQLGLGQFKQLVLILVLPIVKRERRHY